VAQNTVRSGELVTFLRRRDYKLIRELGQGACGQTVLLHDQQIDEHFVCKKYVPFSETHRQELFINFVREIKLLHQVHHENLVRIFNYYLYPDQFAGFILMEYINGANVDEFLAESPERTSEIFLQAINGFAHLERAGILHRDIRPGNLMVRSDGILKIIDLGFGKRIDTSEDFDKSITLNWWCETPDEFKNAKYDFQTEVYFVGKLFEKVIREHEISHFKYADVLRQMCAREPSSRAPSFVEIEKIVQTEQFTEIDFTEQELVAYREFSSALRKRLVNIDGAARYTNDLSSIQAGLGNAYRGFMLEEMVPDAAVVLRCFIDGGYRYYKEGLPVWCVREFVALLRAVTEEKRRIIIGNLQVALDAVPRHTKNPDDDIPF
jgi:eukaryotic-like serine/threonine-protein kinase